MPDCFSFCVQRVENLSQRVLEIVLDVFEEVLHEKFVILQHLAKSFRVSAGVDVLVHQKFCQIRENAFASAWISVASDDLFDSGVLADVVE